MRAHSNYKILSKIETERKKMDYERTKIKNLIGNNPFRVKNYVQGDELDNSLVPLKLLKPKNTNFDNDDDFIENYLIEKAKEEKKEAEERKKAMKMLSIKKKLTSSLSKTLKIKKKNTSGTMILNKQSSILSDGSKLALTKRGSVLTNGTSPTPVEDTPGKKTEGKAAQLKN